MFDVPIRHVLYIISQSQPQTPADAANQTFDDAVPYPGKRRLMLSSLSDLKSSSHPNPSVIIPLGINLELQAHSHGREFHIEQLQNARNSNDSNILSSHKLRAGRIHPLISLVAASLRKRRTATAANGEIPAGLVLLAAVLADGGRGAEEGSALATDGCFGVVGAVHEAVLEEESCAVGE
jgi:hypothetical protein